jgi:hypothetical protein
MKKILLVILSIILFIFIPGKSVITGTRVIATTPAGFDSCLHKLEKWKQWWPGTNPLTGNDSLFDYDGDSYKLSAIYRDGATIGVNAEKDPVQVQIRIIPYNRDSITAEWRAIIVSGNNPITRISRYKSAGKIKKNIEAIFSALCQFSEKTENMYGYRIERSTFTEINLIAYQFKSDRYPPVATIYNALNRLRQYIVSQGAGEKYYPMMNTRSIDSSHFETMIAVSIDREIPANGEFFIRKMVPMKDRFLKTEVTGGNASIENAHRAIKKYMTDRSLFDPAIPFEILVTDRSKVTDTAGWKTIIFYPSM